MAAKIEIVAAGIAHADVMAALHGLAFADPALSGPAWDAPAFAAFLVTPSIAGFILMEDGLPRALSLWRQVLDEGELLTIGTTPGARGRGLGAMLLRHGLIRLKENGVARVFLEVAVTNTAAQSLYASNGFTNAGRRRGYYQHAGQSIDANVMVIDLT